VSQCDSKTLRFFPHITQAAFCVPALFYLLTIIDSVGSTIYVPRRAPCSSSHL